MHGVDQSELLHQTDPHIRPALKANLLLQSHGITDEEYQKILEADRVYRQEEDQLRKTGQTTDCPEGIPVERPVARDEKRERAEAMAARARKKREREREIANKVKQRQVEEDMQIWERKILPRWPDIKHTKMVLEMCRRGIPPNVRGRAWRLLIGNALNITPDLFAKLHAKAVLIQQQCAAEAEEINTPRMQQEDSSERDRFEAEYEHIKRQSEMLPRGVAWDDVEAEAATGTTNAVSSDFDFDEQEGRGDVRFNTLSDDESDGDRESSITHRPVAQQLRPQLLSGSSDQFGASSDSGAALSPRSRTSTYDVGKEDTVRLIGVDLPRTFPHLAFFHDGGPLAEGLENVLQAYACYRPDLGYVQGMSYLAAFLLLYMEPIEAFISLANMLAQDVYFQFYRLQPDEVKQLTGVFDVFFQDNLPLLYDHMKEQGVQSEMFLIDWLLTLYSKVLPLEATARVWDGFLYEGEIYSIRVALGILKYTAPRIRESDFVDIRKNLTRIPEDSDEDELFEAIASIKIPRKKFHRMLRELREQWAAAGKITLTERHITQERKLLFGDRRPTTPSPTAAAAAAPRSESPTCVIS